MRKLIYLIPVLALLACHHAETLFEDTVDINEGYYLACDFSADEGDELEVDIEVTKGGSIDCFLVDDDGLSEFRAMNTLDTLFDQSASIDPDWHWVLWDHFNQGDAILFSMSSTLPVDVLILDDYNYWKYYYGEPFSYYKQYLNVVTLSFEYEATASETLNFVIDNTSYGTPPQGTAYVHAIVEKRKATSFTQYEKGNGIGVKSKSYTFEVPKTDDYHIILNNGGGFGTEPTGDVTVKVSVVKP